MAYILTQFHYSKAKLTDPKYHHYQSYCANSFHRRYFFCHCTILDINCIIVLYEKILSISDIRNCPLIIIYFVRHTVTQYSWLRSIPLAGQQYSPPFIFGQNFRREWGWWWCSHLLGGGSRWVCLPESKPKSPKSIQCPAAQRLVDNQNWYSVK